MIDDHPINLEKTYPIRDDEGMSLIPYTFTITNTCETIASYQINLEILNTTTLENLGFIKVMLNDKINLLTHNTEVTKTLENAKTSYKLNTGYLKEFQSKSFELRLWMDEDTPVKEEFMNKIFESIVTVRANYVDNLENEIIANAISLNEKYSTSETFSLHIISEKYDIESISEDLEIWEESEVKGKDITIEKSVKTNGTHTFYFMDEVGNISEVNVTATKIDDQKPVANMNVTKINNVISIDASSSKDNETSILKYYYSKDGINYEESRESSYEFTEVYEYGVATTMLTNYEKNQIKKVYLKVEDEVGNISDVKEYSIPDTDFAYDNTSDNNLRYIGASPNNYVSFNNELWRIIGVMNNIDDGTGKKETRIKLIRSESIGTFSWDTSASGVNGGRGINEWSKSDVSTLLNDYYYNSKSNQICYNGANNATTTCDFSTIGLSENSKKMIVDILWNIGSNAKNDDSRNITTNLFYEYERSKNIGKICTSGPFCNDTVLRTTSWIGKIGLIYPSDYGYATSGGIITSRESCLASVLLNWNDESISDCKNNNWLYNSNDNQWSMTSRAVTDALRADIVFSVMATGRVGIGIQSSAAYVIRPILFLNDKVNIISGTGGISNPFIVSLGV